MEFSSFVKSRMGEQVVFYWAELVRLIRLV